MPTVAPDTCVKFAIYYGDYDTDKDGDGKRPGISGGDCDDTATGSGNYPGAVEIVGDGIDNDCDGLADEDGQNVPNSTDTDDADHDGQSVAQGDCNDHDPDIYKGHPEICGDGKDNDCDGVADRSTDAQGNVTACSPFDVANPVDIKLDPLSFDRHGAGDRVHGWHDRQLDEARRGSVAVQRQHPGHERHHARSPDHAARRSKARSAANGAITAGRLGGVIDAKTADTIRGLNVPEIGLTPDNSLLDAVFANLLGPLLALPKANATVQRCTRGCRTPDIDVDGDGLEAFCDSNPNDDVKAVDICIDGDGTVVKDTLNPDGTVAVHCTAGDEGRQAALRRRHLGRAELHHDAGEVAQMP